MSVGTSAGAARAAAVAEHARGGTRRYGGPALVVVMLLLATTAVALRLLVVDDSWILLATAAAPYLMPGAPAAVVVAALDRRWLLAVLAVTVTVVAAATQLPLFRAARPPGGSLGLTMMTANLRLGSADAAALVRLVERHHVDVLTTQELTPAEVDRLRAAGLDRLLPHAETDARPQASGAGIWSRYPLRDVEHVGLYRFAFVTARVDVPTVPSAPTVVATHLPGPWPQPAHNWVHDIAALPATLRALAAGAGSGAVLVGGDLNATFDMRRFRDLLRGGFHDAATQSGAGLLGTYPGNSTVPPVIAIDHVLTHQAVATNVRTFALPGSDHRALLVRLALPRSVAATVSRAPA